MWNVIARVKEKEEQHYELVNIYTEKHGLNKSNYWNTGVHQLGGILDCDRC